MAMALSLNNASEVRDLYLYDTYSGMSKPRAIDISCYGEVASQTFRQKQTAEESSEWCLSGLEEVKRNLFSTGYPKDKLYFVKGMVEKTIPECVPSKIALLRLDTDWYQSTKHELVHLYPLLAPHGILIVDDYGYWRGAKKAVDEYLLENNIKILMNRIDSSGRLAIKLC